MTVIIADVSDNGGYMASDSQTSHLNRKLYPSHDKISKVPVDHDEETYALVGGAGKVRDIQVIRHKIKKQVKKHTLALHKSPTEERVMSKVVEPVRKDMDRKNSSEKDSGKDRSKARILLIVNKTIFSIGTDFSVLRYQNSPVTVGSGSDLAFGAYKQLTELKDEPVPELLSDAIDTAKEHAVGCSGETYIVSTDGEEQTR